MTAVVQRDGERDEVAVEEPLEIRVEGAALTVTMRTPGHDEELALGFLHGEGLIDRPHEAGLTEDLAANVVDVRGPLLRDPGDRRFYTTSSCGVCGKGSLEEVAVHAPILPAGPRVARALLAALCREYRRRRDALLDGLAEALPPGSAFNQPEGGMFVWARLPEGWDAELLLHAALEHDVAFVPGHPFFAREADPRTLRLSFTPHVPDEIAEGLGRLRRCWSTPA